MNHTSFISSCVVQCSFFSGAILNFAPSLRYYNYIFMWFFELFVSPSKSIGFLGLLTQLPGFLKKLAIHRRRQASSERASQWSHFEKSVVLDACMMRIIAFIRTGTAVCFN